MQVLQYLKILLIFSIKHLQENVVYCEILKLYTAVFFSQYYDCFTWKKITMSIFYFVHYNFKIANDFLYSEIT